MTPLQPQQAGHLRKCCPECDLNEGHDGEHLFFTGSGHIPEETVADECREALVLAEAVLHRAQTYIGLLRQYDGGLSIAVAHARETANAALAKTGEQR